MKSFIKLFYILFIFSIFISTTTSAETLSVSVSSSSDDAEEYVNSGSMNLTSSDLELVEESSTQVVGMRFQRVTLPKNANVTNAYIQFTVDEINNDETKLLIYAQDNANPPTFTTSDNDISNRPLTSKSVQWNVAPWTTTEEASTDQQTPDLKDLVEDIQGLSDWESGNSMVFVIKKDPSCSNDDCKRVADSYDGSASGAPQLIIEYTLPDILYAYNDFADAMPDSHVTIYILDNDTAGSNQTLVPETVNITDQPQNGTVFTNSDGSVIYEPNSGFVGTDTFYYTVENTASDVSNKAKVTINVGYVVGDRDFTIRNPKETRNIQGNYAIGGNINLCTYDSNGNCFFTTSNGYPSKYVDIDGDSSTVNSSSFDLNISSGSEVVWAGLYWQGVIHNSDDDNDGVGGDFGTNGLWTSDDSIFYATKVDSSHKEIDLSADNHGHGTYGANKIKFKVPGSNNYIDITAEQLDFFQLGYAGFANVTSLINKTAPNGQYTVADIKSQTGVESSHGNYAAWSLVVIYKNNNEKFRNITLFDGFVTVDTSYNGNLLIDGFLTPKTPPVNSKLAFFTMDGDGGDNSLHIINEDGVDTNIIDPEYPNETLFNSSIEHSIIRDPDVPSARMDLDIIDLQDVLGPFNTRAILQPRSGGDRYTASFFIMSSELYVPQFCYDYAYKQQDVYFTEENDGTHLPKLAGNVLEHEPIELTIFIKNLVDSDIEVTDMTVNILDINTTQLRYIRDTTKLALNTSIPEEIPDNDLAVSDSYIQHIPIGTIQSNDHFYVYYSLDPFSSDINDSINFVADYNLNLNGTVIPYELRLGENMSMCSTSNFKYAPESGIYNIVHEDYYKLDEENDSAYHYYNLPTQVTKREGNFKLIVIDPNDPDYNTLLTDHNITYVDVEMIDASAFHDTNASCNEQASSISETVGLLIDANITSYPFDKQTIQDAIDKGYTNLTQTSDFYSKARKNSAFRVIYYQNAFDNGNQPAYNKVDDNTYDMIGWQESWDGENCVTSVNDNGESTENDKVANYCQSGHGLNSADIVKCTRCISYPRYICSRDNFAIRPESFLLKINDQNQSDPASKIPLTNGYSGNVGALAPVLDLAAGYAYNLEINATNFINNDSSPGYTRSFGQSTPYDISEYTWEPRSISLTAAKNYCNDENNVSVNSTYIRFLNGSVDANTSLNQVGEYRLHLLDTTWTAVDSDTNYMTHHNDATYFIHDSEGAIVKDCMPFSTTTQLRGSSLLNGCWISSSHTNPSTNVRYNDFNVTFHPYTFDVEVVPGIGLFNIDPSTLSNPFIYMSNINTSSEDENMSLHLRTKITARGRNSIANLSNYVNGCFAQALDINISQTNTTNDQLVSRYNLHDINMTKGDILLYRDINNSTIPAGVNHDIYVTMPAVYFDKNESGITLTTLNYNYDRDVNISANPEKKTFLMYKVTDDSKTIKADLNLAKVIDGNTSSDQNLTTVTFYYGRTAAKKTRVDCDAATAPCKSGTDNDDVLIYYEVFCYKSTGGNWCLPITSTLPKDINGNPQQKVDIRWFMNFDHNQTNDGNISQITEIGNNDVNITGSINPGGLNYVIDPVHAYNLNSGLPYIADMNDTVPAWLIYDENNASAVNNEHTVIFRGKTEWSGEHDTNTTTQTTSIKRVNRRTMW